MVETYPQYDIRCKCPKCKHGGKGQLRCCFSKACACCTEIVAIGIIHKGIMQKEVVTKYYIQDLKSAPSTKKADR